MVLRAGGLTAAECHQMKIRPHHSDGLEQHKKQRRTPKHLEEYILAYKAHRPASSSHFHSKENEEQQLHQTEDKQVKRLILVKAKRLHSPTTSGPLSTTSLKQLIESISRSEEEEKMEIPEFTHKLRQYEHRQCRRQELLEHITSFLQEDQEDEEPHEIKKCYILSNTSTVLTPLLYMCSVSRAFPIYRETWRG